MAEEIFDIVDEIGQPYYDAGERNKKKCGNIQKVMIKSVIYFENTVKSILF